jgi:hypothetical protein
MKTFLSFQGSLRVLLVGAVAVILTGCVGVVPVPVSSHVEYGQKLQSKQTVCIRPGHTTRAEVIAALGTNYATFRSLRSIAYTWELSGGGGAWWIAGFYGGTGGNWVGGWRGFLIAFDERDVVRAAEFKKLSARRSLDDNMGRWVAKLPPAPPLGTAGVEVVFNLLPAPQR